MKEHIGQKGWFWDNEEHIPHFSTLSGVVEDDTYTYKDKAGSGWNHFSTEIPAQLAHMFAAAGLAITRVEVQQPYEVGTWGWFWSEEGEEVFGKYARYDNDPDPLYPYRHRLQGGVGFRNFIPFGKGFPPHLSAPFDIVPKAQPEIAPGTLCLFWDTGESSVRVSLYERPRKSEEDYIESRKHWSADDTIWDNARPLSTFGHGELEALITQLLNK